MGVARIPLISTSFHQFHTYVRAMFTAFLCFAGECIDRSGSLPGVATVDGSKKSGEKTTVWMVLKPVVNNGI